MVFESDGEAALALRDSNAPPPNAWGPTDTVYLQFRLRAIARYRPSAVVGVLDYWLGTPQGESDFDVRG